VTYTDRIPVGKKKRTTSAVRYEGRFEPDLDLRRGIPRVKAEEKAGTWGKGSSGEKRERQILPKNR